MTDVTTRLGDELTSVMAWGASALQAARVDSGASQVKLDGRLTILAGTANPPLAAAIARELDVAIGACTIDRFPDGEVAVQLLEPVRRKEVYLVQPTSPPVDNHLFELFALADACRRAAAARITAIVPYFGYGRADRRDGRPEPVMARVVADLLETVGVDAVMTVDLHTPQIEGFFRVPVDTLSAVQTLCRALRDRLPSNPVVVAPDVGRMQLATQYAQALGVPVTVLHKRRDGASRIKVTHVVGDVFNRSCLIVDDMISTGNTLAESIDTLLRASARPEMIIAATHGLFRPGARAKLDRSVVREVFVTDTVQVNEKDWAKLQVVPVAPAIAEVMEKRL